jgi:hypothetical protein
VDHFTNLNASFAKYGVNRDVLKFTIKIPQQQTEKLRYSGVTNSALQPHHFNILKFLPPPTTHKVVQCVELMVISGLSVDKNICLQALQTERHQQQGRMVYSTILQCEKMETFQIIFLPVQSRQHYTVPHNKLLQMLRGERVKFYMAVDYEEQFHPSCDLHKAVAMHQAFCDRHLSRGLYRQGLVAQCGTACLVVLSSLFLKDRFENHSSYFFTAQV